MSDIFAMIDRLGDARDFGELRARLVPVLKRMAFVQTQSEGAVLEYREAWHQGATREMFGAASGSEHQVAGVHLQRLLREAEAEGHRAGPDERWAAEGDARTPELSRPVRPAKGRDGEPLAPPADPLYANRRDAWEATWGSTRGMFQGAPAPAPDAGRRAGGPRKDIMYRRGGSGGSGGAGKKKKKKKKDRRSSGASTHASSDDE